MPNNAAAARVAEPSERTLAGKQTTNIHGAFINVCAGVENVKRDTEGQVGNQKYKYATLESVLAMLHPLLVENGLALSQYVDGDVLRAKLISNDGEMLDFGAYNLGPLDKHQTRGSAISYGRRYQLCAIFGVAQEDDDGADASQKKIKPVFESNAKRNAWSGNLEKLMDACPDLGELRAVWSDALPILTELKESEAEYDQIAYEHLVKKKDLAKANIESLNKDSEYFNG